MAFIGRAVTFAALRSFHTEHIMTRMPSLLLAVLSAATFATAQDNSESASNKAGNAFTYGELKVGYGVTQFGDGLSERYEAGNFGTSGGVLSSIAAYRKFDPIDHLHFGLKFKAHGAMPSNGDNSQEMFFNFWSAGVSTKYFPFSATGDEGLYLQGDYYFTTQFTQKYRRTEAKEFDHQFAIGSSVTLGLGYQYKLSNGYALVATVEYDWASRRGEVQGIGDVTFQNSNVGVQLGLVF
jgi:hypothetical protein